MPIWVGLYRGTYFILEICSWKWMLRETNMKERDQICCLYSEVSEASMSEGHLFSALNKLIRITAIDRQRMKQIDFFHDIREKRRKRVLEIPVNENWKPNPCPLLQLYRRRKPQLWLCKESHRPGSTGSHHRASQQLLAISYPVPGKGQSTQ